MAKRKYKKVSYGDDMVEGETVAPKPKPKPKPKLIKGLYGNKKNLIQDSGNAGAHNPVVRHPS